LRRSGWQTRPDGRLEPNEQERATLMLMWELRDAGFTLRGVAAELNARGVPTRRGNRWYHELISLLLSRHPR
jgi:hypothetical protein